MASGFTRRASIAFSLRSISHPHAFTLTLIKISTFSFTKLFEMYLGAFVEVAGEVVRAVAYIPTGKKHFNRADCRSVHAIGH